MKAPSAPDLVTLTGYMLGLWWAQGGPAWAGLVSIVADEADGRLARALGETSERGSALDWGADVALTPFALARLGRECGNPDAAMLLAPVLLLVQAAARARGERPSVGSVRAVLMLAAMAVRAKQTR